MNGLLVVRTGYGQRGFVDALDLTGNERLAPIFRLKLSSASASASAHTKAAALLYPLQHLRSDQQHQECIQVIAGELAAGKYRVIDFDRAQLYRIAFLEDAGIFTGLDRHRISAIHWGDGQRIGGNGGDFSGHIFSRLHLPGTAPLPLRKRRNSNLAENDQHQEMFHSNVLVRRLKIYQNLSDRAELIEPSIRGGATLRCKSSVNRRFTRYCDGTGFFSSLRVSAPGGLMVTLALAVPIRLV